MICVELLWDFGVSDECSILFLENQNGNFQIVNRLNHKRQKLEFYISKLNDLAKDYTYEMNHLPKDAYIRNWNIDKSVKDILQDKGFKVIDR